MGFSKVKFGREEIFNTIMKDIDGRELENWTVLKKDYPKMLRLLNKKYNLGIYIIDRKKKEKDLDWAL